MAVTLTLQFATVVATVLEEHVSMGSPLPVRPAFSSVLRGLRSSRPTLLSWEEMKVVPEETPVSHCSYFLLIARNLFLNECFSSHLFLNNECFSNVLCLWPTSAALERVLWTVLSSLIDHGFSRRCGERLHLLVQKPPPTYINWTFLVAALEKIKRNRWR